MLQSETLCFFRAWLAAPRRVASIVPSGAALASLITRDIDRATGPVLELGPGTGVFTRALLGRGVPERDLTLVEFGAVFADRLRRRFPLARVLQLDAGELRQAALFTEPIVGAVISGLPLLAMRAYQVMSILDGAFGYLGPRGAFYQFTYGPHCPISPRVLDRLGLEATRVGHTLRNLPPASVYRVVRCGSANATQG